MRIHDLPSAGSPGTQASPKLQHAAHEFEAAMLTELLKPLREQTVFSETKEDDGEDSGSEGSLRSFGTEAVARAISDHGGLGIARLVLDRLAPAEHQSEPNPDQGSVVAPH